MAAPKKPFPKPQEVHRAGGATKAKRATKSYPPKKKAR
jgi:hypothetical protein